MILAGDIGGTKSLFALYESVDDKLEIVWQGRYVSNKFPTFSLLIDEVINDARHSQHPVNSVNIACLAIAGPIENNTCQTTNLPWFIDAEKLAEQLNINHVKLINDVEASAISMPHLSAAQRVAITPWQQAQARSTIAILAPGTGLGEAALIWDGQQYHALPSEGGHKDFSARNELELALYRFASDKFPDHLSWERLLGGAGFKLIYDFLKVYRAKEEKAEIQKLFMEGDVNATITQLALSKQSPLCEEAVLIYISLLAAEAGNIALQYMAKGGVIIAGGIGPKILPLLKKQQFTEQYLQKGRYNKVLRSMPVHVCLDQHSALSGAAHCAAQYKYRLTSNQ